MGKAAYIFFIWAFNAVEYVLRRRVYFVWGFCDGYEVER